MNKIDNDTLAIIERLVEEMKIKHRNDEIVQLRADGLTLQAIGDKYGLSRERIRQILSERKKNEYRTE